MRRGPTLVLVIIAVLHLPAPARARGVSLERLLTHADRHAPRVQIGRARLQRGEAELSAARPLLPEDPELELAVGPRLAEGGRSLELEAALRQRLEISGARGLRIRAAERTGERLQAELERTRWQVHRQVHAAYHTALVARQRVEAARLLLTFARQLLEITRKRHAAGAISMLHVRVAEGEAAQAAQRAIQAEAAYRAACLRLGEVSGWPTDAPAPLGGLDTPRPAPRLERLLALARRHNPALAATRAVVAEAEARAHLAGREAFPRPALGVAYSREAEVGGAVNHIVVGTLELPLPLWRRNDRARARAHAELSEARVRRRALEQTLPVRVSRAAATLDAAARRIAVYGAAVVPAFKRSLEMIGRAYTEGKVDVLQVMVARSRFLEIQREALDAYQDYYEAHAALEQVVGSEIWAAGAAAEKEKRQ